MTTVVGFKNGTRRSSSVFLKQKNFVLIEISF